MVRYAPTSLSSLQQFMLVALRTCIGWHFLYEGYIKLLLPAWGADGTHLGPWSSSGYLRDTTGPVGHMLHALFDAGYGHMIDVTVIVTLCFIGLSLMLGLFTQFGCSVALGMLSLFYLTVIPLDGAPHAGAEGNYLLVNKTLIEGIAVALVFCFRTGRIAGLDLLYFTWRWRHKPRLAKEVL